MTRVLVVGLDDPLATNLRERLDTQVVMHPVLPRVELRDGELFAESARFGARMLPITHVVYHAIFENDFDFITALALWRGPTLPSARGMLDCRLKHPCLVRALAVSRYDSTPRGFLAKGTFRAERDTVAKWGNWHCGENKLRFEGQHEATEATVYEPFIQGRAVRIAIVGDRHWQIDLAGDDWKKSIHHPGAAPMAVDDALLADARALADHFGLQMIGVDYIVADDGTPHLLEVNHIPNVTVFDEMSAAFIDLVDTWLPRA